MKAINITAYTEDDSQIEVIKAVFKAFKINSKISKTPESESPYNPVFLNMIKGGEKDLKDGKGIKMTLEELDKLCN